MIVGKSGIKYIGTLAGSVDVDIPQLPTLTLYVSYIFRGPAIDFQPHLASQREVSVRCGSILRPQRPRRRCEKSME